MRVSAKADYAMRAAVELAAAGEGPTKGERIAQAQEIPLKFLENILVDLRNAGHRREPARRRGRLLAGAARRPRSALADVIRAVDGPLANVRGVRSEQLEYRAAPSRCATCGSRCARACAACSRRSRSPTSPAASYPSSVRALAADPDAWAPH